MSWSGSWPRAEPCKAHGPEPGPARTAPRTNETHHCSCGASNIDDPGVALHQDIYAIRGLPCGHDDIVGVVQQFFCGRQQARYVFMGQVLASRKVLGLDGYVFAVVCSQDIPSRTSLPFLCLTQGMRCELQAGRAMVHTRRVSAQQNQMSPSWSVMPWTSGSGTSISWRTSPVHGSRRCTFAIWVSAHQRSSP